MDDLVSFPVTKCFHHMVQSTYTVPEIVVGHFPNKIAVCLNTVVLVRQHDY